MHAPAQPPAASTAGMPSARPASAGAPAQAPAAQLATQAALALPQAPAAAPPQGAAAPEAAQAQLAAADAQGAAAPAYTRPVAAGAVPAAAAPVQPPPAASAAQPAAQALSAELPALQRPAAVPAAQHAAGVPADPGAASRQPPADASARQPLPGAVPQLRYAAPVQASAQPGQHQQPPQKSARQPRSASREPSPAVGLSLAVLGQHVSVVLQASKVRLGMRSRSSPCNVCCKRRGLRVHVGCPCLCRVWWCTAYVEPNDTLHTQGLSGMAPPTPSAPSSQPGPDLGFNLGNALASPRWVAATPSSRVPILSQACPPRYVMRRAVHPPTQAQHAALPTPQCRCSPNFPVQWRSKSCPLHACSAEVCVASQAPTAGRVGITWPSAPGPAGPAWQTPAPQPPARPQVRYACGPSIAPRCKAVTRAVCCTGALSAVTGASPVPTAAALM